MAGARTGLEAVAAKQWRDGYGVVFGELNDDGGAGAAGASKVLHVLEDLHDEGQIAKVVSAAAESTGAE